MTRINITDRDDGAYRGWFDWDSALTFTEDTTFDGSNRISRATGSQWEHEELYHTRSGSWVMCCWSQRQGSGTAYHQISEAEAFRWLTAQDHATRSQWRPGWQRRNNLPAFLRERLAEFIARAEV